MLNLTLTLSLVLSPSPNPNPNPNPNPKCNPYLIVLFVGSSALKIESAKNEVLEKNRNLAVCVSWPAYLPVRVGVRFRLGLELGLG